MPLICRRAAVTLAAFRFRLPIRVCFGIADGSNLATSISESFSAWLMHINRLLIRHSLKCLISCISFLENGTSIAVVIECFKKGLLSQLHISGIT